MGNLAICLYLLVISVIDYSCCCWGWIVFGTCGRNVEGNGKWKMEDLVVGVWYNCFCVVCFLVNRYWLDYFLC